MSRRRFTPWSVIGLGWLGLAGCIEAQPRYVEMRADVLEDKIRGGLLGQLLGNLNGLPHENQYIDEPGRVEHYMPNLPEGARTDDDTDIEWVYVVGMEKSGKTLLSPDEISQLWQRHINRKIWCANAYARELMWVRIDPPLTGKFALNPWSDFNISGQFICESFGLICPAMPRTAAKIGLHYTHVTIEGEPAQTTQLFTAMIATAFVEDDLNAILDAGLAAIDPKSLIDEIVTNVRRWHAENPSDWRKTRALVKERYTHHNGEMRDRNGYELNTASTIAALLYGRGDLVETLRTAFNFGWDADNNAATAATIVGVIRGRRWMDEQGWNIRDVYANTTRDEMPMDETITSFGSRLVRLAGHVIAGNGGGAFERDGQRWYRIRREQPAMIENLPSFPRERAHLETALRPRIDIDLTSPDARTRAGAAYLAICLDHAPRLAQERPADWKRALDALREYGQVGDALYRAPLPAAEPLKAKAAAAGLARRGKP